MAPGEHPAYKRDLAPGGCEVALGRHAVRGVVVRAEIVLPRHGDQAAMRAAGASDISPLAEGSRHRGRRILAADGARGHGCTTTTWRTHSIPGLLPGTATRSSRSPRPVTTRYTEASGCWARMVSIEIICELK